MNYLKPSLSLLIKLGSIAVHAEEILSPNFHPHDIIAVMPLLNDPEFIEWRKAMDKEALLPVMRNPKKVKQNK